MVEERQEPQAPTLGPQPVYTPPTVWSAVGNRGNRRSTEFGGYQQPTALRAPRAPQPVGGKQESISRDAFKEVGKTKVAIAPYSQPAPLPEGDALEAPERKPGFFEGMLGGLVDAFTGVVPEGPRDVMVRGGELIGEALDVPGEILGHVPVNQLLGLEDLEGAFDLLMRTGPMTAEKRQVIAAIANDRTEADWYMSYYLRRHAGDYAAAKGLPQLLANLIMPDATIQERLFMGLGLPSQLVGRQLAGGFAFMGNRALEIINDQNLDDPMLLDLRERYLTGQFGAVGSKEAIDRLTDEISRTGYAWSNDPFIGMLAEMATDPLILTSFGSGIARGAVRTGALSRQMDNLVSLARSSPSNTVKGAVSRVDSMVQQMKQIDPKRTTESYEYGKMLTKELGDEGPALVKEAQELLRHPDRGVKGSKDYYAAKLSPVIERLADISYYLNEPLSWFGKDGVGGVIARRMSRDVSTGMFAAYGMSAVGKLYDTFSTVHNDINQAFGHLASYYEVSGMQDNLAKHQRVGLGQDPAIMPDARDNPDTILDRMRGYKVDDQGNRTRDVTDDELNMASQQVELQVRRHKRDMAPDTVGIDDEGRRKSASAKQLTTMREEARRKMLRIAPKADPQEVIKYVNSLSIDELSMVHGLYWGKTIELFKDVQARVESAARAEADRLAQTPGAVGSVDDALLKEQRGTLDKASRATLVGDEHMTMDRAIDLVDRIDKAADMDDKVEIVRRAVQRYDVLNASHFEKTRITKDSDWVKRVVDQLKEGIREERYTTVLSEQTLLDELPELAAFRQQTIADGQPYEIGLAPARDKRFASILNENGELIGYHSWMDIRVTPEDIKNPTSWTRLREAMFTPIRGENIMQEARRTFFRSMNNDYGVGRDTATALWDQVRKRARDQRITMRGLTPGEFRAILDDIEIPDWDRQQLGYRGLAEVTAKAMAGDLSQLGVTSRLTGAAKTKTARYQNWLGVLAEKIYPLVRFNWNPLFQMQELIEPYFFNILRGIKPGARFSAENVRTHTLIDEMSFADRLADGFEAREFMMAGAIHAKNIAGAGTDLSKVDFGSEVGTRKRGQYYSLIRELFGERAYKAFQREMPGRWEDMAAEMRKRERDLGNSGNLTNGQVAESWLVQKGARNPDNGWNTVHHYDGAVPDEFGNIRGITVSYLAKNLGLPDAGALRAAIADPLKPQFSEHIIQNELVAQGFTPEYAARAWGVLTGPTVDDVLDALEGDYADKGLGFHRKLAQTLLQGQAVSKRLSLDEYVAHKFSTTPARWVDKNARMSPGSLPQLAQREMERLGYTPLKKDDPFNVAVEQRATEFFPETSHTSLNQHVTQSGNVKAEVESGERVPLPTQIPEKTIVEDFEINPFFDVDDFIRVNERVLGTKMMLSIAGWYPEMAPMFSGYAKALPDSTVLEYARLLDEVMPTEGRKFYDEAMAGRMDETRQEIGARMLMAWGATQVQTSPRDGFQFVMNIMDMVSRGERVGAKGIGSFKDQKAQFRAMLVTLEDSLKVKGLGAKLQDFIDSILGNSERSFMRNAGGQEFAPGIPMQPGAMDIWMGRAKGFIDNPMLNYLAQRIGLSRKLDLRGKSGDVWDSPAMVQAQIETGFLYRRSSKKTVFDEEKGKMVEKDVPEDLAVYRKRIRSFERKHKLKKGTMREAWDGSPTPAEYEQMLRDYNQVVHDLNDRQYLFAERENRPWTMAEVQAIEWDRIQFELDIDPGGPNNMFYQNAAQVSFNVEPIAGSWLADAIDFSNVDFDALDLITEDASLLLQDILQEATGVTILRSAPGMGGYIDSDGYSISPNTHWTVLGSDEAIDDALMGLSLLTQNNHIFATKPSGRAATKNGPGKVWAIDFVPEDRHPLVVEALGGWLDSEQGTPQTRTPYERATEGVVPEGGEYDVVATGRGSLGKRPEDKAAAERFATSVEEAKAAHPFGAAVTAYPYSKYGKGGSVLIQSKDGRAGVAVTPEGDLVSVHKHPESSVADMKPLIAEAANRSLSLDAYDIGGVLPDLYAPYGFRVVGRVKFNPEFAPDDWDYGKFGEPDVVVMVKDIDGRTDAFEVPSKEDGGYESIRESVPYWDDYDELVATQQKMKGIVKRRDRSQWKWNGHTIASDETGNVLRTAYLPEKRKGMDSVTVPQGSDIKAFEERAPIPESMVEALTTGSWAQEAGLGRDIPVQVNREVHFNRSIDNDYLADRKRVEERIGNGEDPTTVMREEVGRDLQERMREGGREGLADSLVNRHMDTVRSHLDASFKEYDKDGWAAQRSGRNLVGAGRRRAAKDAGLDDAAADGHSLQQRGRSNEWLASTNWSRKVDLAQKVGRGKLSGRSARIDLREGRPDVSTIPHELFHIWSDDLDPSAVRTIHDAFFDSSDGKQYLANGGTKPTGRTANNHLVREAEEWTAYMFERYLASGLAPNTTLQSVFNNYASWHNTFRMFNDVDPNVATVLDQMTPELHRGPNATFNVDEYRIMEVLRMALLQAEEEAHRVHYYKRGRSWLERSINHPYLGMYPASYMWGKVLPEMIRFLVAKPFGVEAPMAGLADGQPRLRGHPVGTGHRRRRRR